jgi:hypothetical protein
VQEFPEGREGRGKTSGGIGLQIRRRIVQRDAT